MRISERAKQYTNGAKTLADWLYHGQDVVDQSTAQQRANVCLKCPENQRGGVVTTAVALAIKQQLELKNNLKFRVQGERGLKTCHVCACVNRLKIWIPLATLTTFTESLSNYPAHCWLRTEQPPQTNEQK